MIDFIVDPLVRIFFRLWDATFGATYRQILSPWQGFSWVESERMIIAFLIALIALGVWSLGRGQKKLKSFSSEQSIRLASITLWKGLAIHERHPKVIAHQGLMALSLLCFLFAFGRPQVLDPDQQKRASGIDIMLAIDTSGSMRAQDYVIRGQRPNRLQVIKDVLLEFIEARPSDRLGLVVFGSEAFTQAPLTLDHKVLKSFLTQIAIGMAGDATAIGDGLATAVLRLKDISDPSKVVVLLTDGSNNSGRVDPIAAMNAAKALGIRVHTIGVGSQGETTITQNGQTFRIKADIDEALLSRIAQETGGLYRTVTDTEALRNVYAEIDRLEKSQRDDRDDFQGVDLYPRFLVTGLLALFLAWLWRVSPWRPIPS